MTQISIDGQKMANYERDFYQWTIEQSQALREQNISPSMKPKLQKDLRELFNDAKYLVVDQYDVKLPEECPYTLEELLG